MDNSYGLMAQVIMEILNRIIFMAKVFILGKMEESTKANGK